MKKIDSDRQLLIRQAARLVVLGHEVEHKRSIVKRIAELGVEPSMELFRAIDDFNVSKMAFDQQEREHLALRERLSRPQR